MEQNVYLISLTGISVVFILLTALYFILKLFKYLPSSDKKIQDKKKGIVEIKSKKVNVSDPNIIAIITVIMAKKNISSDRISIKKLGGS